MFPITSNEPLLLMRKIVNGFDQTHFGHLKYVVDVGGRAIIDQSRSLACAE